MARFEPMHPGSAELADIFSELQIWPLVSLQPLDQNQCLVLHLKDLFHICLEPKAQAFWMTFNLCNCGSKYPYFNRAYVVSGGFGCPYLYIRLRTDRDTVCMLFKERVSVSEVCLLLGYEKANTQLTCHYWGLSIKWHAAPVWLAATKTALF